MRLQNDLILEKFMNNKEQPDFLFGISGKHVASWVDEQLYAPSGKNIGHYLSDLEIFIDMNGLKAINDQLGHDVGDELLRRMGNILTRTIANTSYTASRIGGDEFVILMPAANEQTVESMIMTIEELLNIDNQYYSSQPISIAIGYATTSTNEII